MSRKRIFGRKPNIVYAKLTKNWREILLLSLPLKKKCKKKLRKYKFKIDFFQLYRAWSRVVDYSMQHAKIERIKLSQKAALSSCILIDKYRLSAILKKIYGEFHMQGQFWGLYLHYWKFSGKKMDTLDTLNKNYKKIVLFMPQIMGQVKIPGPPLPPLKKTTLRENDRK